MERLELPISMNTSENNFEREFYLPCLKWAIMYERGVGYFTSGWIQKNIEGLANYITRGGRIRWIISPYVSETDFRVMSSYTNEDQYITHFRELLLESAKQLAEEMARNVINTFAWMLYDNIVEIKFAFPASVLDGDFHDKFGIFYSEDGSALSFNGSINDSAKGFANYESIKIFSDWNGSEAYVRQDIERFKKLWNNQDSGLSVLSMDDSLKNIFIAKKDSKRPYELPKGDSLWPHQKDAMSAFFQNHCGILEMATGTGKTRTALAIMDKLFAEQKIQAAIIGVFGNDLLNQWYKQVIHSFPDIQVFRYYDSKYKELPGFILYKGKKILIISRDADRLKECITRLKQRNLDTFYKTLLVVDEVHGFGSLSFRNKTRDCFSSLNYRLGLSATPEREYDEEGNEFIKKELGPVIYRFALQDAIKNRILCPFVYVALKYELTEAENLRKRAIIASYAVRKKQGEQVSDQLMFTELANVNKTSISKLLSFKEYVETHPQILNRSLIFVETMDYGIEVQKIVIQYVTDYHTYYGVDDESHLQKYSSSELNCLITSRKISEGIDISSVNNIILFTADRSQLTTIQRIGRALRKNPEDPQKVATVIDFIKTEPDANDKYITADEYRKNWLTEISLKGVVEDENI